MTLVPLFIAVLGFAPSPRWCAEPHWAEPTIEYLRDVVTAEGAEGEARRQMLSLPAVPPEAVVAVTDEAVCRRLARIELRYELGPDPRGGIVVVQVGDRYVVSGAVSVGDSPGSTVYSRDFVHLIRFR